MKSTTSLLLPLLVTPTLAYIPQLSHSSVLPARPFCTALRSSEDAAAPAEVPAADAVAPAPAADISLDAVETLGRGAAKSKRGKRKGASPASSAAPAKAAAALAPEETYYEGPPAITETILPTASILTVVGIIPAAAAWARQAWVRYRITTRRIRVTSGVGGKDMAEIVYPDIVEIRTAKRLFGDGDLVAFLRDGAKFEMRNIPEFDQALEFILKQCDEEVVKQYREKGNITK
uniref:YdbS-like PH domain-containing protein n=1 Tax=Corethron hystrix TaxID=216773 RepID=A0A7S1BB69_9STRA|mmetsp:Transcript_20332/g.46127  ORF Transcript_20332/g.46127 Transcript_20332/m.46127 type:complete len:233 (+) Transcript_20332:215-913(+)|eukprot:CAMPEP_0113317310 /NCGR_PEP_ID=MMETSP0010_2-20120614/12264_1 /TAXON_ID=216773 ORGANISM="Corethron hystrix, Strain 308" /NCGR_SAMPLE_ID=MMETSP0010_2 /ASSEMBLY_ACC=CAM_ASM_000155 /LENGTH=232 /DNA_ID=CAMNT_0000174255 /DNA_START=31 /DNA_END=729 /DNA_ORIENTATION=- /assembly_acc=CAM_ASM_000155